MSNKFYIQHSTFLIFFLAGILILAIFIGFFIELKRPLSTNPAPISFIIEQGDTVKNVIQKLEQEKLSFNASLFKVIVDLRGLDKKLLAGEHLLPRNLTLLGLIRALTSGAYLQLEKTITIIEGWDLADIELYFREQGIGKPGIAEIWEIAGIVGLGDPANNFPPPSKDFSKEFDFLTDKPKNVGLEGYLFPDTYRIFKGALVEDVVRKMLDNFGKKLTSEMRQAVAAAGRSIFEVVTMASLVEKEVPHSQDRPIVAGIFWKRLEAGMPLQADSTVNFATRKKSRALSARELALDSPYNTYKYKGLPPTPIGNPGLDAIKAAIYPQDSSYWYFLSKEDRETVFSKTFEEHKLAKARYIQQ